MRRTKDESRELYELKRNHDIELLEIKNKIDDKDEENEYFKKKIERLETDNQQLRVGKGDSKKMRELENQVHTLQAQLQQSGKGGASGIPSQSSNMDLRNVKKTLTQDETLSLQKEMAQLDMIIKGYEEENRKLMKNSRLQE